MQDEMQDGFLRTQCLSGFEACDTGESNPCDFFACFPLFYGLFRLFAPLFLAFFEVPKSPYFRYLVIDSQ